MQLYRWQFRALLDQANGSLSVDLRSDQKLEMIAFIDRHDGLTMFKFCFEAFFIPIKINVFCLTNNAAYKETCGNA